MPHDPQSLPYLFYDDVAGAIQFLTGAFGFTELSSDRDETGAVHHAQLAYRSRAVAMLAATGERDGFRPRKSPAALGGLNAGVYVWVDDVDAHAAHARVAGAKILRDPAATPSAKLYSAEDAEGQLWTFATPDEGEPVVTIER